MFWTHGQPCNTSPLGPCPGLLERLIPNVQLRPLCPDNLGLLLGAQRRRKPSRPHGVHALLSPWGGTAGFLVGSRVRAGRTGGTGGVRRERGHEEGRRRARYGRFPGQGVCDTAASMGAGALQAETLTGACGAVILHCPGQTEISMVHLRGQRSEYLLALEETKTANPSDSYDRRPSTSSGCPGARLEAGAHPGLSPA